MASSLFSRRLTTTLTTILRNPNPISSALLTPISAAYLTTPFSRPHLPPPAPNPTRQSLHSPSPHLNYTQTLRLSTAPDAPETPELRHQEITGPTVERDTSALAEETRQSLADLRKAIYDLSSSLALLGIAHLGAGAWIAHAAAPPREVTVQGLAAFAFPFALAFLLRRTLKPLSFYGKVEDQGRLQVLTLALQSTKHVRVMLSRARIMATFCVVGVSVGSIAAVLAR